MGYRFPRRARVSWRAVGRRLPATLPIREGTVYHSRARPWKTLGGGEPCAAGTGRVWRGGGGGGAGGGRVRVCCPTMRPLPTFHCPFTKLAPDLANSVAYRYCWARGSIAG